MLLLVSGYLIFSGTQWYFWRESDSRLSYLILFTDLMCLLGSGSNLRCILCETAISFHPWHFRQVSLQSPQQICWWWLIYLLLFWSTPPYENWETVGFQSINYYGYVYLFILICRMHLFYVIQSCMSLFYRVMGKVSVWII